MWSDLNVRNTAEEASEGSVLAHEVTLSLERFTICV